MKRNSIFKKVSALKPDPQVIASAVNVIKTGGIVAFPTSGLYGLGADALNRLAVERVYRVKQRDFGKPILVLIKDALDLKKVCTQVPELAIRMMAAFWPGRLTIILEARPELPDVLTGGTGKIGIRVPLHPVARALVTALDSPITGTSANLSGKKGCSSVSDLNPGLAEGLDLVLDAGHLEGGIGSTVVDVTFDPPLVVREGAISKKRLSSVL
ncbi:MAG: threonylcarbamoyl-AMP synthase [Deltaproteobacteria bacterium]|nr:threonylcarbamoyl-AMP synthase [Deltaproteobacteria bacterium]